LAKGGGYFYFQFGEAADWLDRRVNAASVGTERWKNESMSFAG
jgi:hypothetical protein